MGGCSDLFSEIFRIILFISNVVIFLIGCGIFSFGISLHRVLDTYPSLGGFPISAAIIFMSTGAIMAIISFCGCFGAASRRFSKILYVYGALLLIILGVEIVTAIYGYVYKPNAKMLIERELKNTLKNYGPETDDKYVAYNSVWDRLQQNFECCGVGQLKNDSFTLLRFIEMSIT